MKRLLLGFWLLSFSHSWSQLEYPVKELIVEDFAYPDFGDGSFYGNFSILYPLTKSTLLGVRGSLQQNILFNRFNLQLMARQRILEKLYGVGGLEVEWDLNQSFLGQKPSDAAFLGLEYQPKSNISINSGLRMFLNEPSFNPLGTERTDAKTQWNSGFKVKF